MFYEQELTTGIFLLITEINKIRCWCSLLAFMLKYL
jgi:hypothetical protein